MTTRQGNVGNGTKPAERRRAERRVVAERRREVRWEPGKKIRRDGKDRRATGEVWGKTRKR